MVDFEQCDLRINDTIDAVCCMAQILGRRTKDSVSERVKMSLDYNIKIKRGFWILVIISQDGTRLHNQDRFLSRMPSLSFFKLSLCAHAVMMGSD